MENRAETTPITTEDQAKRLAVLEDENARLKRKVAWLEEQFRLSQKRRFGASSEQTPPDQLVLELFNEAEAEADSAQAEPTVETITYKRKKSRGGREAKTAHLPIEEVHYAIAEEDQICPCCGEVMHQMSTETRDELIIIPAQVKLRRHVRPVTACRRCAREDIRTPIVTAPMPAPVYPGSLASASMMAYVMEQKYVQSIPLYRQEQHLTRMGVDLSRQTLANWMIFGAEQWLAPLFERMQVYLLKRDIAHADETTFPVLHEPGRAAQSKKYLWLYSTGNEGPAIFLYDYQPTREGEHPRKFLEGFSGYLQTDGYSAYHGVKNVTLVGCWAHARRGFFDALKALPKGTDPTGTQAQKGLKFCNDLYAIERELRGQSPEIRHAERLKHSVPVLDVMHHWLQEQQAKMLPKSKFGEAVTYALNQWEKLKAFLKDGRLEIDNNRSERAIKPFVIGRKNWMFANTPRGAKASATIYSLVETAKANQLHPYEYLKYLFEQLPQLRSLKDTEALDKLLPWSTSLPLVCRVFTR